MVLSSACGTTAMANGVMLVETASVADVHAEADDTSPVLATLSGTQAKVLENSGRWMKVQVGNITGWVESEHLTDGSDTLDDIAPVNPEETQNPGDTEEQTEQTQDLQTEETHPADTAAQDRMSESSSEPILRLRITPRLKKRQGKRLSRRRRPRKKRQGKQLSRRRRPRKKRQGKQPRKHRRL